MDETQLVCVFNPVLSNGPHPSPLHFPLFPLRLTFPRGHFPRLAECAHFHYETVDFGNVQVSPENLHTHRHTHTCAAAAAAAGFSASVQQLSLFPFSTSISPFLVKACCSSWLILFITALWCQRQLA